MPTTSSHVAEPAACLEQPLAEHPFRGVLVPLDGSTLAEQALSVGAALAKRAGAPLHLVAVEEAVPAGEQRYLDRLAEITIAVRPGTVRTAVLEGQVPEALGAYAERGKVGLMVLTTHGRGGLARWWLGSIADQLLQKSVTPLLLLHPSELPQSTTFNRIMVGLDGESDRQVLEMALTFGALTPGAHFVLTRVIQPEIPLLTPLAMYPHHLGPNWDERRVDEARLKLTDLVDELQRHGHTASWKVIEGRGIADCVLELSRALGADCLVVGTHGLTGVERMAVGSVAAKILRGAQIPVLVVPMRRQFERV